MYTVRRPEYIRLGLGCIKRFVVMSDMCPCVPSNQIDSFILTQDIYYENSSKPAYTLGMRYCSLRYLDCLENKCCSQSISRLCRFGINIERAGL